MTSPSVAILGALEGALSASLEVAGVGVDLVDVAILEDLLTSGQDVMLDTAWTGIEQQDADGVPERLAARWAAKEAVMKALGRGLGDVDPLDIEVVRGNGGAPEVRLRGSAAEVADQSGVVSVHVSMSHEQGWAVGFAVAVPRLREDPLGAVGF